MVRTAEVLRQVEGTGIEKMVGSVKILVSEVCHPKQNLRSTWTQIILSLQRIELNFPIMSSRRLLKARHGDMPAGHWTEMTAEMYEIKIRTIACA